MSDTDRLLEIADAVGTPTYVYDAPHMRGRIKRLERALEDVDHHTCYAVKANDALAMIKIAALGGLGADVVSGGELLKALRAGIRPEDIVFSGIGKQRDEIEIALDVKVRSLNVESRQELDLVAEVARAHGTTARVSVRVNPAVEAGTHRYISTGHAGSKFGIPIDEATGAFRYAADSSSLNPIGMSFHVGSQLLDTSPITSAAKAAAALWRELEHDGIELEDFDAGGGLGVPYEGGEEANLEAYLTPLAMIASSLDATLVLELGRWLTAEAGVLLSTVLYTKQLGDRWIAVCDAGMNDLLRPALYEAWHPINVLTAHDSRPLVSVDVVGPVCESGDFFALARELPRPKQGDLIAVGFAGAYSRVMSSTYNARPLAAEVLIDDAIWRTIRKRPTIDDLSAGESL